jgi:hypothetical protein
VSQLFVYGSLLEAPVIKQLIGRVPGSFDGTVEGFRRDTIRIDDEDWFIAVRDKAMSLEGKFLTLEKCELAIIDDWEGPEYQRVEIAKDVFLYAQPVRAAK